MFAFPRPRWLAAILLLLQVGVSRGFSPADVAVASHRGTRASRTCPSPSSHPSSSMATAPSYPTRRHHTKIIKMASSSNDDDNSSSLNMDSLRTRMNRQESQYARLLAKQSQYADDEETHPIPESVHIILFHPDTPQQHVHTIEYPKDSGINLILAFESGRDCADFARALRDLEFVDPNPEETMFEPFRQYCDMSGMSLVIVPRDFELTPPQMNANDGSNDDDDDDDGADAIIEDDATTIEELVEGDEHGDLDAWG